MPLRAKFIAFFGAFCQSKIRIAWFDFLKMLVNLCLLLSFGFYINNCFDLWPVRINVY